MRRLLAMTVMTVTLVGVTPSAALAGGMLWHSKLYHAPGSAVEPPTETEPLPVDRADPASGSSAQSVPFDSLWLTIAGIVGLSLVARTVFSQSR